MARSSRDLRTLTDTVEHVSEVASAPARIRALRVVASYATDADDCRMLLTALGLLDDDNRSASRICVCCGRPYEHAGVRRRDRFCSARCYRQRTAPAAGRSTHDTADGGGA
ncbi:hypothetical protein [Kitasatospora sp. NPDC050543]|uniref:hypothetical protein n=1 Tax=Kitasatospora sp. NPDC050543 TaxID=3364054 RepID=UPI0037AB71BB